MRCKKIRGGWQFTRHRPYQKPGLYFGNIMDKPNEYRRLHEKDVIDIRDFLSRWINENVKQRPRHLYVESRSHIHALLRTIDKLEAK